MRRGGRLPENLRSGMAPTEARRQAILKFGAIEVIREHNHSTGSLISAEILLQDARYAFRKLRRSPAFFKQFSI